MGPTGEKSAPAVTRTEISGQRREMRGRAGEIVKVRRPGNRHADSDVWRHNRGGRHHEGNESVQRAVDGVQRKATLARVVRRKRIAPVGRQPGGKREILLGMREDMQLPDPLPGKQGKGKNKAEQ